MNFTKEYINKYYKNMNHKLIALKNYEKYA